MNGHTIELYSVDGWLYHGGDNSDWALPDGTVQDWIPVSIGMFSGEVPDDWNGTGWFKTTIQIDSTLVGKEMGIQGRIYGAMELYLNGELIGKAGVVGNSPESEESIGYFEPFYFSFDDQQVHHIAIRYSNHNYKVSWHQSPIGPLLTLGIAEDINDVYTERSQEFIQAQQISFIQMGFFIALAMLHLILFWYYPKERANVIYAMMMMAVFIGAYYSTLLNDTYIPENFIQYLKGEGVFVTLFSVLNIYFVYEVTQRKINWLPVLFSILALSLFYLIFTNPAVARPFYALLLYSSFLLSIGFFARDRIIKKWRDLDIILAIYTLYFILILPRSIGVAFASPEFDFLWAQSYLVFAFAGFLIPIGYSVYLAKNVAVTNRNLEQKLEENEQLSAEKLQAEKEKQLIIYRQKEQLEEEVAARTADLKKSLEELKSAQDQLVQQEKLASLGQLTAGIAHEIKNPLNFVNNFSEVSTELIQEAREEIKSVRAYGNTPPEDGNTPPQGGNTPPQDGNTPPRDGNTPPQGGYTSPQDGNTPPQDGNTPPQGGYTSPQGDHTTPKDRHEKSIANIEEILDDIEANLRKIHEHGSRADGIVKSMLMHSRGGSGKMEPMDVNTVLKEFVNLAFHGMRASKNPINVDIELDLDDSIGKIPMITEDFSRVILNLCNNAFDAMREKLSAVSSQPSAYHPKLTVRTKAENGNVTVEIEDNGSGIPDEMKDKILQPFFTTKKGTEGTGLGLSITNDIVKAHGAELKIDTKKGDFTKFIVHFNPI